MSEQIEMFKQPDTRLSYSSSTLLNNCSQKYYYYKVLNTDKDKDTQSRDDSHFHYGTSFHYILENSMHEKPKDIMKLLGYCVKTFGLKEEHIPHVHASVIQYLRLREGSGFKAVKCEYAIKHPKIIGYIDLIEAREDGSWYISDLKTASTFYDSKIAHLPSDPQLNLYCSFYKEIAEDLGLDPDKFMGARYLVATKSKANPKKDEEYIAFVSRLADPRGKHIKCVFVTVPKSRMRIEETRKEMEALHDKSMALRSKKEKPKKNFSYCNAFFRSCEYFSKCHGLEFSEFEKLNEVIVERT